MGLWDKIVGALSKGSPAVSCQAPGDLTITVKRSDTGAAIAEAEVNLAGGPTQGTKQTDATGIARWNPCQAGDYVAAIALQGDAAKECENPQDVLVTVEPSMSKSVEALAIPKGELVVLVKQKDTGAVIPNVELSLSGGPTSGNQKTDATGIARWKCGAGDYVISFAFAKADADKYEVPPDRKTSVAVSTTTSEEVLVERPYTLRVVLIDGKNKPRAGRPWEMSSPVARNGTTGADGLIRVKVAATDTLAQFTVKEAVAHPPAAAAGAKPPPAYPPTIRKSDFKDADSTSSSDAETRWSATIVDPEKTTWDTDDALRERLHNLGFAVDAASDAAATQAAVKKYQRHYLNNPNGSGALADISGDLKNRHDRP